MFCGGVVRYIPSLRGTSQKSVEYKVEFIHNMGRVVTRVVEEEKEKLLKRVEALKALAPHQIDLEVSW